jgi:uncharacterized membrane protein YdbT with pleckstrin-like domain
MKLSELGQKIYQILLPIALFAGTLTSLKISTQIIIFSTVIFTILYIIAWHEIRIRNLEKGGD